MTVAGWAQEPDERPLFRDIKTKLDSMFAEGGSSIQEEVEKTLTIERGMSLDPNSGWAQEPGRVPPPVRCMHHHSRFSSLPLQRPAPQLKPGASTKQPVAAVHATAAAAAQMLAKRAAPQNYTLTYTANDGIEVTKSVFRQVVVWRRGSAPSRIAGANHHPRLNDR